MTFVRGSRRVLRCQLLLACVSRLQPPHSRPHTPTQSDGLSGHFPAFWPPVNASGWVGGGDTEEDWIEIWPYVIQGYFPQAILLRDPQQLAQCEAWVNNVLAQQAAYGTGWMGIRLEKRSDAGMIYWPQVRAEDSECVLLTPKGSCLCGTSACTRARATPLHPPPL